MKKVKNPIMAARMAAKRGVKNLKRKNLKRKNNTLNQKLKTKDDE
tara:strand:- start:211 stop:345 length:135 start_codon:yes stop_codon:yes gene_type:complete